MSAKTSHEMLILAIAKYEDRYKIEVSKSHSDLVSISDLFTEKKYWPAATKQGIYCIFSATNELLYVGKASMSGSIGARLSCHFWYDPNTGFQFEFDGSEEGWGGKPVFLCVFPTQHPYEAPSLEEYLINELRPPGNVRGVR